MCSFPWGGGVGVVVGVGGFWLWVVLFGWGVCFLVVLGVGGGGRRPAEEEEEEEEGTKLLAVLLKGFLGKRAELMGDQPMAASRCLQPM